MGGCRPCEECGSIDWNYCSDPCPRECDRAGEEGVWICHDCTEILYCKCCGVDGCDGCVKTHCASCEQPVCDDCRDKIKPITFGCGHQSCNVLVLKPQAEDDDEEEEAGGGAEVHPHCPKCQRAHEKAAAELAAAAAAKQYQEDLPGDIALVESILPQVKTSQLKQMLEHWMMGNPNPQAPASKKQRC